MLVLRDSLRRGPRFCYNYRMSIAMNANFRNLSESPLVATYGKYLLGTDDHQAGLQGYVFFVSPVVSFKLWDRINTGG